MEVENFKILLRISRVYIFEVHRKVDNKNDKVWKLQITS